jgi:hypothetical protein
MQLQISNISLRLGAVEGRLPATGPLQLSHTAPLQLPHSAPLQLQYGLPGYQHYWHLGRGLLCGRGLLGGRWFLQRVGH